MQRRRAFQTFLFPTSNCLITRLVANLPLRYKPRSSGIQDLTRGNTRSPASARNGDRPIAFTARKVAMTMAATSQRGRVMHSAASGAAGWESLVMALYRAWPPHRLLETRVATARNPNHDASKAVVSVRRMPIGSAGVERHAIRTRSVVRRGAADDLPEHPIERGQRAGPARRDRQPDGRGVHHRVGR